MTTTKKTSSASSKSTSSTYAIVEAAGKQFWMEENRYYDLDRIKAEVNQSISIEKVLLLSNDKDTLVGKPYVENASVQLKVLEHRRGSKLIVYKMRPKKKTRRKNGHRQELTRVMVESITTGSQKKSPAKSTSKQKAPPANSTKEPTASKVNKTTKKVTKKTPSKS